MPDLGDPEIRPQETTREQPITKSEAPRLHEVFAVLTGIESIENEEVASFRANVTEEAGRFLTPLYQRGFITGEEKEEVMAIWENVVALDEDQLKAYKTFHTETYRLVVETLSQADPKGSDEKIQILIAEARRLLEEQERSFSKGVVLTFRGIDPRYEARAKEVGMPKKWIVANWNRKDDIIGTPYKTKTIVYEETTHLLSKLSDYKDKENVSQRWVEEMMARVIVLRMPSSPAREDREFPQISKEMRAEDYLGLFDAINKMIGDDQALLRMFFGKEPINSRTAENVEKALAQFSSVGKVIDAGMSLEALRKYLAQEKSAALS